jgi:hypothetical protein
MGGRGHQSGGGESGAHNLQHGYSPFLGPSRALAGAGRIGAIQGGAHGYKTALSEPDLKGLGPDQLPISADLELIFLHCNIACPEFGHVDAKIAGKIHSISRLHNCAVAKV